MPSSLFCQQCYIIVKRCMEPTKRSLTPTNKNRGRVSAQCEGRHGRSEFQYCFPNLVAVQLRPSAHSEPKNTRSVHSLKHRFFNRQRSLPVSSIMGVTISGSPSTFSLIFCEVERSERIQLSSLIYIYVPLAAPLLST